jgi:hypothetical protein
MPALDVRECTSPSPLMVHQAAETVYLAWRKHVGEAEAREQAQAFARRFCISIDGPLAPLPSTVAA